MIHVDELRFPVIDVRLEGAHTDEELEAYFVTLERLMRGTLDTGSRRRG